MTLTQLKYAVTVAEVHSINAAARSLYISQPSLSTEIKKLEEELQFTLYNRTNRGISVTKEGEEFIRYARNVLIQYQLLEAKFIGHEKEKKLFAVTMHHSTFATKIFASLIQEFGMEEYEYSIFETKTQSVIEDIKSGKSELGILYLSTFNQRMYEKIFKDANLAFHTIVECDVCVYLGKQHPLADREEIRLEELEEYPCLLFEQDYGSSLYFYEEVVSAYAYKNVIKTSDRATTIDLLKQLPSYSIGVGIVTESQLDQDIVSVRLQSEETMLIGYLLQQNQELSALGEWYVEKVREYLQN